MKAWLITWDWIGDAASMADVVVGVLNPRKSATRVAEFVEFLYYQRYANLGELTAYASNRTKLPYRAEIDFNQHIRCGHNPWLSAKHVFDLKVETDPDSGVEVISWQTYPLYAPREEGPVKVREGMSHRFRRIVHGPVSHEEMWDRAAGRFKDRFRRE